MKTGMENLTQTDTEETFRTSDINLAAFLLVNKCGYVKAEKAPSAASHTVFVHFSDPDKCKDLEKKFRQGDPKVPVKSFLNRVKEARDIIFEEMRRAN